MKRAWIFNRPVLLEGGLAGRWGPATARVMAHVKRRLESMDRKDQLDAFNCMVMALLQVNEEFRQEGVEQGFVVPVRGGDGAHACPDWHGDREWSEPQVSKVQRDL